MEGKSGLFTVAKPSLLALTMAATFSTSANETFSTAPGTRANAMGGAYIAVARDATSIWYNPAGMTNIAGKSVMAEFGHLAQFKDRETDGNVDGGIRTDLNLKYAGYAQGYENWGFGIAYFKPYIGVRTNALIEAENPDDGIVANESLIPNQFFSNVQVEQISLAAARKVGPHLSIGATLDIQRARTKGTTFSTFADDIPREEDPVDDSKSTGIGWVLGALYTLPVGENGSSLSLGAVYRDSNVDKVAQFQNFDTIRPGDGAPIRFSNPTNVGSSSTPRIFGGGLAFDWVMAEQHSLLVSGSFESVTFDDQSQSVFTQCDGIPAVADIAPLIGFGSGNDFCAAINPPNSVEEDVFLVVPETKDVTYDKFAFGGEYSYLTNNNMAFSLRAGYNKVDGNEGAIYFVESEGVTAGIGFGAGNFNVDFAFERREITSDQSRARILFGTNAPRKAKEEIDLLSLSVEFSFGS